MKKILLNSYQRFCLDDGPGIRTTFFLMGCGIRCPWCANPETLYFRNNIRYDYSSEEILNIALKDQRYYESGGGVTFSGGEPLLQADALETVFRDLKNHNINICMESSLFVPTSSIKKVWDYVSTLFFDIKIINANECLSKLGGNIEWYYDNLNYIFANRENHTIISRIPLVKEYTCTANNISDIMLLLEKYRVDRCEIFSVHNLARNKYASMDIVFNEFDSITDEILESVSYKLEKSGVPVMIKSFQ